MRFLPWLAAGLFAGGVMQSAPKATPGTTLIFAGDTRGYLSPCGCTKPMTGGIRRLATAVRGLGQKRVLMVNASLVNGVGRQDEIKLETQGEAWAAMGAAAVNLGASETELGPGAVSSLARLANGKLLTGSLASSPTNELPSSLAGGPVLVGGASVRARTIADNLRETPRTLDAAVQDLVDEAKAAKKLPVLMLDGDEAAARGLASRFPQLLAIAYRSVGQPPSKPIVVGKTWLVSPGEEGKFVVRAELKNGKLSGYSAIKLAPEYRDDPKVSALFDSYLERVRAEGLLDKLPRTTSVRYVGSQACQSCHSEAYAVWESSRHAKALASLEREKQDRDPDCVGCHVVGLESQFGFRSRKETAALADVGCESCHGGGADHVESAGAKSMGSAGAASCRPCHTADHSPTFDFATYWAKIHHSK